VPKAVVISHEATMNGIIQLDCYFRPRPGEKWLVTLPGFVGLGTVLLGGLAVMSGGTMLLHDGFDPEAVVRTLDEEGIALTALVPLMIERLLAVPGADRRRYESLRAVMYTTAPMSPETLTRAMEVLRCGFYGGYGMTELGNITMQGPNELRRWVTERPSRLASVGRPHPGTEVRIADPDGNPLPAGQAGEVLVKGPGRMAGYWNRPEATAAAVRDGWLRTGDLGYLDEDGYLYVHDRLVNLVVTRAGRVIPREVEVVLLQHPAVAEAAVIGQPDGEGHQAVNAVVALRPGASASADEIIQFCAARLPPHATPRSVEYVDALPRNFFYKVEKAVLRARFGSPDACDVAGC
jgi:fatty-acyl-CoA synthase